MSDGGDKEQLDMLLFLIPSTASGPPPLTIRGGLPDFRLNYSL
mgnify:CR=1 FL=1